MSAENQVRVPYGVASVAGESDFDPPVDVVVDPSGRSYDNAYLDGLADEADRLGPPKLRRGRPPQGATSGGHGRDSAGSWGRS